MRSHLVTLLLVLPGLTACLDDEGDGDDTDVTSQELVSSSSCSYVAPTCPSGATLRVDLIGYRDQCYRAGVFGAQWSTPSCPTGHPVLLVGPGPDRCGLDTCSTY